MPTESLTTIASRINTLHDSIAKMGRLTVQQAIEIGGLLSTVKAQVGHGGFHKWIVQNCRFTSRQARRYMQLHEYNERPGKTDILSDLDSLTEAYQMAGVVPRPVIELDEEQICEIAKEIKVKQSIARRFQAEEFRRQYLGDTEISGGERWKVLHGDCEDVLKSIPDHSIGTIFTDPPYLLESADDAFHKLGRLSSRLLTKKNANLFCFCGNLVLPMALDILRKYDLKYAWTIAYLMPDCQSMRWGERMIQKWTPILWFTRGTMLPRTQAAMDAIQTAGKPEKFHKWAKDSSVPQYIIEQFTIRDEIVLDPFCGGGSIPVAALTAGRRVMACDVDEHCCKITSKRLGEVRHAARSKAPSRSK